MKTKLYKQPLPYSTDILVPEYSDNFHTFFVVLLRNCYTWLNINLIIFLFFRSSKFMFKLLWDCGTDFQISYKRENRRNNYYIRTWSHQLSRRCPQVNITGAKHIEHRGFKRIRRNLNFFWFQNLLNSFKLTWETEV